MNATAKRNFARCRPGLDCYTVSSPIGAPCQVYICLHPGCLKTFSGRVDNAEVHVLVHKDSEPTQSNLRSDVQVMKQQAIKHVKTLQDSPLSPVKPRGRVRKVERSVTPHNSAVIEMKEQVMKADYSKVVDVDELASRIAPFLVTRELKLYKTKNGKLHEIVLSELRCSKSDCKSQCDLVRRGSSTRSRCFDNDGPFKLSIPNIHCQCHNSYHTLLELAPDNVVTVPQLLVFPRTIVTSSFAEWLWSLVISHHFNFSSIWKTITSNWKTMWERKIAEAQALHQFASSAEIQKIVRELDDKLSLSSRFLEDLYLTYSKLKVPQLNEARKRLWIKTGQVLRIDHTYKVVQNLSAYSETDKTRVQIKASVCSILNEFGHVLVTKVVPSDSREHVEDLLTPLFKISRINTTHVFTDDSRKDRSCIQNSWKQSGSKGPCPSVCQDVWHVIHRVDQAMNRKHSDYKSAKVKLSKIFGTVTGKFESDETLDTLLRQWLKTYENKKLVSDDELILSFKHLKNQGQMRVPLVDNKVRKAISNIIDTEYLNDILQATSLEDFKQGTSQNENWHKFLKRTFLQYSGNVSIEFVSVALRHLQHYYNSTKDATVLDLEPFELSPTIQKLTRVTADHPRKSLKELQSQDNPFQTKKQSYDVPLQAHVQQCREYLQLINDDALSINTTLFHNLVHDKFQNKFSKAYVRLLVQTVIEADNC